MKCFPLVTLCMVLGFALAGCGGGDDAAALPAGETPSAPLPDGSQVQPPPSTSTSTSTTSSGSGTRTGSSNAAPKISGSPQKSIVAGTAYEFQPVASDTDGDSLSFTVQNKPAWAEFDGRTGALSGTPDAGDVGVYSNIVINASDGDDASALPAFSITVNAMALGSATLTWTPPTQNSDGTALTTLAGYRIYYGTSANDLGQSIEVDNAGITRYVVENLAPARWYFGLRAYTSTGLESTLSALGSKQIQ